MMQGTSRWHTALWACLLCISVLTTPDNGVAESAPYPLWQPGKAVPTAAETPFTEGTQFRVIKRWEPDKDGFNWLHGVALVWHQDILFSFWGHNQGEENTPTERAAGRHSMDGGKTWSPVWTLAPNLDNEGRSHGVFLSLDGALWAFLARFHAHYAELRTEAFVLSGMPSAQEASNVTWESRGIAVNDFWPCDRPVCMADGNWIMAGARIPEGPSHAFPAVAISHGNNFVHWDAVAIPVPEDLQDIWGETTLLVEDDELVAVVRAGATHGCALVSMSHDYGRTWSELQRSNLPMPGTKAYAGRLSTGQRYLVGTFVSDHNGARRPLTIAVSAPREKYFSRLYRIRDALCPECPGESVETAALSYPYAVEHNGFLYVGYSNDGGRGRNQNSAEMAIIPIASFHAP